jgi:hypothetical protein
MGKKGDNQFIIILDIDKVFEEDDLEVLSEASRAPAE